MRSHAVPASRLGLLIQTTRQSKKLSLRSLASRCGIPFRTLAHIEHGDIARPRVDVLTAIATALNIPLADIYAAANIAIPGAELPAFPAYLRARYHDLPPAAVDELSRYFSTIARREGIHLDGPPAGTDENR